MNIKKTLSAVAALCLASNIYAEAANYTVKKGDTYWLIANRYGVSLSDILKANNATENSVLYIGDVIKIPGSASVYTAQKGDSYWLIANRNGVSLSDLLKANNATESSVLYVGDAVKIPSSKTGTSTQGNYITYSTYTVQKNDTLWNIAIKCGIPFEELLKANSMTESSIVYEGMKLTYPVHHIAVKSTPSSKYGEKLDWFSEAQYVLPINADFTLIDFETGKSFRARRTVGSGHADCEPLTKADTAAMKEIWGGYFNWNKRSVLIVTADGRKLAASAAGMLHAGNDAAPGGAYTTWRSDSYGAGTNYDYVKDNDANGHFDLYFYNSIGHSSGTVNTAHQNNVLKSAGIK